MALTLPPTPTPARTMSQTDFDNAVVAKLAWDTTNVTEMNVFQAGLNSIAAGTAFAIPYTFSTTTTDSDPGAGTLRLSSATQNASTVIRLDLTGSDAATYTSVIDTFDDSTSAIKGQITLQKLGDATKWLAFTVTSLASPSGYKNLTVVNVSSSAASPFANGDSLILKFTRNGDKGDLGSGSMLLLATLTPTAAANVDFLSTFTASYDSYLIIGSGLLPATDDSLNLRVANAGTTDTGAKYYQSDTHAAADTTASTSISPTGGGTMATGKGTSFSIMVLNANDATNMKTLIINAANHTDATPSYLFKAIGGAYVSANAISGVRFYWGGGANFSAVGKIRVYALTNS